MKHTTINLRVLRKTRVVEDDHLPVESTYAEIAARAEALAQAFPDCRVSVRHGLRPLFEIAPEDMGHAPSRAV